MEVYSLKIYAEGAVMSEESSVEGWILILNPWDLLFSELILRYPWLQDPGNNKGRYSEKGFMWEEMKFHGRLTLKYRNESTLF